MFNIYATGFSPDLYRRYVVYVYLVGLDFEMSSEFANFPFHKSFNKKYRGKQISGTDKLDSSEHGWLQYVIQSG